MTKARINNGEKTIRGAKKTGQPCKRMKLEHFLMPYTDINSKWIKDLNVRSEAIKFPEENTVITLFDINHSNIFLNLSPNAKETKLKINKWGLIKL